MDLAVPVRVYDNWFQAEVLKYSLRTVWHHMPQVERVFVIGYLPGFLDAGKVTYLHTTQDGDKFANTDKAIRAVLESDISEDFIWSNDDIFCLRDCPDPFPVFAWRSIEERVRGLSLGVRADHNLFVEGMMRQYHLALRWGYKPTAPCVDLHVPLLVNKTRLKEVLDRRDADDPGLTQWRMLYGLGERKVTRIEDNKVRAAHLPDISDLFCSTTPASWRNKTGEYLRNRYWRASVWEIQ